MTKIAIFASGSGSNAQRIIEYFKKSDEIEVSRVFSNVKTAKVLERAQSHQVPTSVFNKEQLKTGGVLDQLRSDGTDYIVLAGFLLLIPPSLLSEFPNKIINIHPSLLPKYGGKGMYGSKVHQSVIDNKELVSGITIHLVNEVYDQGRVLFQKEISVLPQDNVDSLATSIHELEHTFFSKVIEEYIKEGSI